MRLLKVILCNVVALVAGLAVLAVVEAVWFPGMLADPIATATLATLMYFSGPLIGASTLSLWRRQPPSLYVHVMLALGWWAFLASPWVLKPWHYHGRFPWKGVAEVWLPVLPPILLASAAFWIVAPRVDNERSSPRLQRTAASVARLPLAPAAEPPSR